MPSIRGGCASRVVLHAAVKDRAAIVGSDPAALVRKLNYRWNSAEFLHNACRCELASEPQSDIRPLPLVVSSCPRKAIQKDKAHTADQLNVIYHR